MITWKIRFPAFAMIGLLAACATPGASSNRVVTRASSTVTADIVNMAASEFRNDISHANAASVLQDCYDRARSTEQVQICLATDATVFAYAEHRPDSSAISRMWKDSGKESRFDARFHRYASRAFGDEHVATVWLSQNVEAVYWRALAIPLPPGHF